MTKLMLLLACMASAAALAGEPKDKAVIEDTRTGQRIEVKVPHNIAEVHQTGPHDYTVHVNREAAKKIEVREVTPPKK